MRIKAAGCIRSRNGTTVSYPDALHRALLRFTCISRSVKSITDRLFMCPSAEMARRKGHNMKVRMYYESKLDKDTIVLDVPDDECEVMIENDYRQRLEQADPQDKARVQRRDPQTIIDEEFNKPTFNSHHTETRRQIAFDALDPEGKHLSDGTDFTEEMIRSADMKLLHRAMKHLWPEQRELLKMVFCENKSQTEIARAEGITEDAVRKRLVRIYERLRAAISFQIKIL